jgi:beta-lactamase regulating signal transducer with metallopeptidase domain
MDMLRNILSEGVVHKLGWTLLHSLWQGCIVVLLLVVCLRLLRKSSANLRYVISCLGLAVIVLLPVVTFYIVPAPAPISDVESVPGLSVPVTGQLHEVYDTDMPLQRAAEYMQMFPTISFKQRAMNYYTSALPYIVFGWFIGVFALSLWYLGGWVHLHRLRRKNVKHVDTFLKDKLHNLSKRLKVTMPVMLMESALVQIPTVVGWFRPVILLPASALSGLSREQLEALLAHELAHIRRYDYLVNMFQTLVEILGFYHPAVWWISYTIRVERENCCDDLAVSVGGDKVGYARALTSMEEVRFAKGKLAVASSGGSLSRRIRRLIGTGSAENKRLGYVPIVISILLIMALMIPTTLAITAKCENRDAGPNSTAESDSTKAVDAYIAVTDKMNDYEPWYPVADLGKTAKKTQILFDCKIYEAPADLKFLEDEQRKGIFGPIVKLLESIKSEQEKGSAGISIQLGKEYADSLKALSRENEYVKVLAAPKLMTLDGKEATVNTTQNVSYTADYETDKGDDKPKPIIKNLPCEMELKVKGEVAKNNTIFIHLRLTQSKPVFATKQDDEGREIQIPIIERSDCTTYVDTRSGESIILGGLRSGEGPSRNLILVITPSIIHPEKGIEKAKIEKEIRAVVDDLRRVVEIVDAEKEKIKADQLLVELQRLLKQDEDRKMDLEQRILELHQKLSEVQMKLAELEARKAELKGLSVVLASPKEAESERKRAKSEEETRYHTMREGDPVDELSVVLDDERIEAAKAVLQEQINNLDVQLKELRKNYEAEIFNRQSEWWAELRAFTADVVAANQRIIDANTTLENDLATLKNMQREIDIFKIENGANFGTDIALYHKLKTMEANRDRLAEKIERDRLKLAKNQKELEEAVARREQYIKYRPRAGTDPNEAERLIYLAKEALERRMAELKGLSSVLASAKESVSEHERLTALAEECAESGDFAKAVKYQEKAIELARAEKYYGIGIAFEKLDGLIRIVKVIPDTPASGSSFRPRDIIDAVDGVSTEGMSPNEVVARITGPKGTKVTLTVKSHSQDITMEETFTRQLPLEGSPALQEYEWRLNAYKAGKTLPQYYEIWQKYEDQLKDPNASKAAVPYIFELKYANPEELAQLLSGILEHRSKGISDKTTQVVRIVPDPRAKKLIILASPADIRLLEALVAGLDISPPLDITTTIDLPRKKPKSDIPAESVITQVFELKYADCESVVETLKLLFPDEQFRMASDKRTNKLIVVGTESAIKKVKDIVSAIDVLGRDADREIDDPKKQKEIDSDLTP